MKCQVTLNSKGGAKLLTGRLFYEILAGVYFNVLRLAVDMCWVLTYVLGVKFPLFVCLCPYRVERWSGSDELQDHFMSALF